MGNEAKKTYIDELTEKFGELSKKTRLNRKNKEKIFDFVTETAIKNYRRGRIDGMRLERKAMHAKISSGTKCGCGRAHCKLNELFKAEKEPLFCSHCNAEIKEGEEFARGNDSAILCENCGQCECGRMYCKACKGKPDVSNECEECCEGYSCVYGCGQCFCTCHD